MYNKSLNAFRAVAEQGSFSKAAGKLYISHTAVIKQIAGLEEHLGVKLFDRSTHGVALTPAGQVLYAESLLIMKQSERTVQKVRQAQLLQPKTLRIGTSALYPCHYFMDIWDRLRDKCPEYALKIISFDDDKNHLSHIGQEFDFIIAAHNVHMNDAPFQFLPIGEYRFCLAVPRSHRLSRKHSISLSDLKHEPLMIMETGTSPINDRIRKDILDKYPEVNIVDIHPGYDVSTFNQCVERNSILLSLECWDRIHPDVKSIPLKEEYHLPYGILYPAKADMPLKDFIEALKSNL